jgi:hypothetical protein
VGQFEDVKTDGAPTIVIYSGHIIKQMVVLSLFPGFEFDLYTNHKSSTTSVVP